MSAQHEEDNKPCPHMRTLVSAWLDDRLTGLAKWYVEWHIKHCKQCSKSVPFFRKMHGRLENLAAKGSAVALDPARWDKIEKAWEETDQKKAS